MDVYCERCDAAEEDDELMFLCARCERYLCEGCFGDVAENICDECLDEIGAGHKTPPPIVPNPKIVGIERRGIGL